MRVLLLGVGMQGEAALYDLVRSEVVSEIIAADSDLQRVESLVARRGYGDKVHCEQVDASHPHDLQRVMSLAPDVVVDLLPVAFIPAVAASALAYGAHLVNTFYVPSALAALAEEARMQNVTILPQFGLDPGIDLVLLGDAVRSMDEIESLITYGAGIPAPNAADNPLRYKISWTFKGVLESYYRPARVIQNGAVLDIDADDLFSTPLGHTLDLDPLGELEAFPNGDALDLVKALQLDPTSLDHAGRYTLRWPGHRDFWKPVVDLGLLREDPVMVGTTPVDRISYLAEALSPELQYQEGEHDLAIVRVEVTGRVRGQRVRRVSQMLDRYDDQSALSAMSRTVGFTASVGAQLIGSGALCRPGLLVPSRDVPGNLLLPELEARGIRFSHITVPLQDPN
jgi:saccharopine dehydrogenase-like NADP-dependent oxidoreductase